IKGAFLYTNKNGETFEQFDKKAFKSNQKKYTVVDIRNSNEAQKDPILDEAINIPLPELRERAMEIPRDKPIVVHCSGGYRSAAGSSIIKNQLKDEIVLDMSDAVK